MIHDEIDQMPAGPELDALACAAVGWEPKQVRVQLCVECGSPKCGAAADGRTATRVEVQHVYRPISTDIATAMDALDCLPEASLCKIDKSNTIRGATFWLASVVIGQPNLRQQYCGESPDKPSLAIARALALLMAALGVRG